MQGAVIGAALYLANTVSVLAMFKLARMRGVHVKLVSIGVGPAIATHGNFVWRILPISGFVRMFDTRATDRADANLDPATSFDRQPRWARALIAAGGCLALVLVAVALRGAEGGWSFLRGFGQLVSGALDPPGTGAALVRGFARVIEQGSLLTTISVVAAKMAAINLLPIPPLPGFAVLYELLRPDSFTARSERIFQYLNQNGVWLCLTLFAAWLWAWVAVMVSG